jgi:ubiquinone/menaquinone biosynthesis C-methylase UbiE
MLSRNHIRAVYEEKLDLDDMELGDDDVQLQYMLRFIPKDMNKRILDAGCGNGRYAYKLVHMGYTDVYAVDLFDKILQNDYGYTKASIDELPFMDNSFDFVYCNSVIFYLDDPRKGIQEFQRVLKPGSPVLITAHTKYSLFTTWRRLKRRLRLKSVDHLRDVVFRSCRDYEAMFRNSGFKIRLVDGYRLSFAIYPFYRKACELFQRYANVELPQPRTGVTSNSVMALIKSIFAYHFIIVAEKVA